MTITPPAHASQPAHAADGASGAGAGAPWTWLVDLVPHDPWFRVRIAAMTTCALVYLWWTRAEGLITDRITASIAIGVFLVAAFVGKPWRRWAQVFVDACCYALLWFAYENTRGAADGLGMPLQLDLMRSLDRVLFLGGQPTEWMQARWYDPGVVGWHDQLLSLVYYTHFVVPVVAIASVWAFDRTLWLRYIRRLATLICVACIAFVLVPTVPPWMASDERFGFGVGEPLVRHTRSGIVDLGFGGFAHDWGVTLDWSNAVAAMPSLHAAFSLFVVLFFLPMLRWRWLRVVAFAYPLLMAVALVYFAEHWVIDVLVGWALTVGVFAAWQRVEQRRRDRDAEETAAALGRVLPASPSTSAATSPRPRRSRRPRPVLVDRSVVDAVVDAQHPEHGAAVGTYLAAVARQRCDAIRLVVRADVLDAANAPHADDATDTDERRRAFAALSPVAVAGQHRRQAARLAGPAFDALDPETRLTLVVARREGCHEVVAVISLDAPVTPG